LIKRRPWPTPEQQQDVLDADRAAHAGAAPGLAQDQALGRHAGRAGARAASSVLSPKAVRVMGAAVGFVSGMFGIGGPDHTRNLTA
jgi:hypothetical protein